MRDWWLLPIMVVLILAVFAVGKNARSEIVDRQVAMCERVKLDRVDSARALTALVNYYEEISHAASVREDVRSQARRINRVMHESANQLRTRILQCRPLIEGGRELLDERLLREAQGDL